VTLRYLMAAVVSALISTTCLATQALAKDQPCEISTICETPVVTHHGYRYFYEGGDLVVAPTGPYRARTFSARASQLLPNVRRGKF
jgi:hypothetical protein